MYSTAPVDWTTRTLGGGYLAAEMQSVYSVVLAKRTIMCLHTVEWFQVLLFNISNSVYQIFLSDFVIEFSSVSEKI